MSIDLAHRQQSISWDGVRKALRKHWRERGEAEHPLLNIEVAKSEASLRGNIVELELRKVFGEAWDAHPRRDEIRHGLHRRLWTADHSQVGKSRVEIRRANDVETKRREAGAQMKQDWDLTDKQAEMLAKLDLPGEWLAWSRTAVAEMLPLMENGASVGALSKSPEWESWRERTFPNRERPTGEIRDRLPSHPRSMPEVRNPTIRRVLNELRKVVNNLIAVYGRPEIIRVELTRELKESKSRRSDRLVRNKKQESNRKKAIADLQAHGIANPSREDIEKWLLWKESSERCPYTGDHIGFEALFDEGKYQVEHIWPRSKWLDNNFSNKTLCRTDINILKGNRTPHQMYARDSDAWRPLKQRLMDCKLPEHKVRRFMEDVPTEAGTDDFADRQLAEVGGARSARLPQAVVA